MSEPTMTVLLYLHTYKPKCASSNIFPMWQSGPSGGTSKDMGINYLALNDLFHMSNEREGTIKYDIYVQMVEIYNEQVRDLLAEDKTENKYPLSYPIIIQ